MTASKPQPAAFLDRDGVLNVDSAYPGRPDQMVWIDGAFDAVRRLTQAGYHIFVVTNQAGVARGFYTEEDVKNLHRWMRAQFEAHGGRIHDFRYCPHHPDATVPGYNKPCGWRKPNAGMLLDLMEAWPVDRTRSFLVGDKVSDIDAAKAASIPGHLFSGGNLDAFIAAILEKS